MGENELEYLKIQRDTLRHINNRLNQDNKDLMTLLAAIIKTNNGTIEIPEEVFIEMSANFEIIRTKDFGKFSILYRLKEIP